MVNRRFVQDFFGGAAPLGRTVIWLAARGSGAPPPLQFEIVGIVGDTRNSGLEADVRPQVFIPYTVEGMQPGMMVLVRTSGEPLALSTASGSRSGASTRMWPL